MTGHVFDIFILRYGTVIRELSALLDKYSAEIDDLNYPAGKDPCSSERWLTVLLDGGGNRTH